MLLDKLKEKYRYQNKELAVIFDVHPTTIARWINGKYEVVLIAGVWHVLTPRKQVAFGARPPRIML